MKEVKFIDKAGQKRNGIETECHYCGTKIISRKDQVRKYCQKECSDLARRNRCTLICDGCGKEFERKPSKMNGSRSGLFFCNRACKDRSQKIGGIKEIQPGHYGDGEGGIDWQRTRLKEEEGKCCDCGEDREYMLTMHHIDGDRKNNNSNNLELVCANCHIKRHLKSVGDKWVCSFRHLTPRDLLDSF